MRMCLYSSILFFYYDIRAFPFCCCFFFFFFFSLSVIVLYVCIVGSQDILWTIAIGCMGTHLGTRQSSRPNRALFNPQLIMSLPLNSPRTIRSLPQLRLPRQLLRRLIRFPLIKFSSSSPTLARNSIFVALTHLSLNLQWVLMFLTSMVILF